MGNKFRTLKHHSNLFACMHVHVEFLGAFKDPKLGPVLVMEKMNENLQQLLERCNDQLSIQEQIHISLEITLGVAFLHQLNPPMVHRDLNDKNVMFTFDGVAKIGDFGQSKLKQQLYLTSAQPGMVSYMPPEALRVEEAKYDESLDIFSLGVLMLEIGTQQPPIVNMVGIGTIPEIKRREKDLQQMSDLHPLKPFILLCLSDDQKQRPKASELEKVLPHLDAVRCALWYCTCMQSRVLYRDTYHITCTEYINHGKDFWVLYMSITHAVCHSLIFKGQHL